MKIAFIHTPKQIDHHGSPRQLHVMIPPIGIWSLAATAHNLRHDVQIIHTGIERINDPSFSLKDYLRAEKPDIVCITLHWHLQLHEAHIASLETREALPNSTIILGGLTATAFTHDLMQQWPHIDLIIRGEAENALTILLFDPSVPHAEIPNLTWRNDNQIIHNPATYTALPHDLDRLEHTALNLLKNNHLYNGRYFHDFSEPPEKWRAAPPVWYLYAGRGCSENCAYCGGGRNAHSSLSNRPAISFRPAASLLADVRTLHKNFGISNFYLCYHPSEMSPAYYRELFRMLRSGPRHGMIFEYYNTIPDPSFISNFASAFDLDKSQLIFSPTAFTEPARRSLSPSAFMDSDMLNMLEKCSRLGIRTTIYYSPLPQENEHDTLAAANKAASLLDRHPLLTTIIMPIEIEPQSPWSIDPKKFGIKPTRASLDDYIAHHSLRRGIFDDSDLGYSFPNFPQLMDNLRAISQNPRWAVFQPLLFDAGAGN